MIILRLGELFALGILAGEYPAQTVRTAAMVAAKLFVGVQADGQQSVDLLAAKALPRLSLRLIHPAARRNGSGSIRWLT
jgi:hypothetical protein